MISLSLQSISVGTITVNNTTTLLLYTLTQTHIVLTTIARDVQVYSQGKGNFVSVKDSNFTRNRANDVGSGLMFGSFLYVQNRDESYVYSTSNW